MLYLLVKEKKYDWIKKDTKEHYVQCWNLTHGPRFTTRGYDIQNIKVDDIMTEFIYGRYDNNENGNSEGQNAYFEYKGQWYRFDFNLFEIDFYAIDEVEVIRKDVYHTEVDSMIKNKVRARRKRAKYKKLDAVVP